MIVTKTFARSKFHVEAIRVTSRNMAEIAEWCGGRVVASSEGRTYIQVPTGHDTARTKIGHAYIGNWVTRLEGNDSFRVYKEKSFTESFRLVMNEADKFAKVHELLMKIRDEQDVATYHGESSEGVVKLIEKTAREICAMV